VKLATSVQILFLTRGEELSADLNDHLRKEELVLFPAIRAIERGHVCTAGWTVAPITAMEQEHDRAGELLGELRGPISAFDPPGWACETVRAVYRGLEQLKAGVHSLSCRGTLDASAGAATSTARRTIWRVATGRSAPPHPCELFGPDWLESSAIRPGARTVPDQKRPA
jgi:hypothetical protein